jgi:glutamyl-tRNA synthetase
MENKNCIVRFAPSPTGYIHIGNTRIAIINYLLAKSLNGKFILRIDDTDQNRCKQEYIDGLMENLEWLDIKHEEVFNQSKKVDIYNNIIKKMVEDGSVYECFETPLELEYKKKLQLSKGRPPIYDRSSLRLTSEEKLKLKSEGKKPHYRFKIENSLIEFNDMIKGNISFKGENISDPVIIREDGTFLYILTSVIDDIEKNITHIVRGEDHLVNTAIQIQMFKYFNAKIPMFAHLPLISAMDGSFFSKRDGSLSIFDLKKNGYHPMAIINYLFSQGLSEVNKVYENMDEIIKIFDITKYNKATAKFDMGKLKQINRHLFQNINFIEVQKLLKEVSSFDVSEHFFEKIKYNLDELVEINQWIEICYKEIQTKNLNNAIIKSAIKNFPIEDFNEKTWNTWMEKIKNDTNIKGKDLFITMRVAITNMEKGPEMKDLLLLIDKNIVLTRLKAVVED